MSDPQQYNFKFQLISFLNPCDSKERDFSKDNKRITINHDLHLIHPLSGSGTLKVHNKTYQLNDQCIVHVPPFLPYNVCSSKTENLNMINFHFKCENLNHYSIHHFYKMPIVFHPTNIKKIHYKLKKLHQQWSRKIDLKNLFIQSELYQLAIQYYLDWSSPIKIQSHIDPLMQQLSNEIIKCKFNFFDAKSLSKNVFLSVSQMNRRFKKSFGMSPKEYWQQIRIREIQQMLFEKDLSIQHIADHFSFQSIYYFSRWFKKMTGQAPRDYRKSVHQSFYREL